MNQERNPEEFLSQLDWPQIKPDQFGPSNSDDRDMIKGVFKVRHTVHVFAFFKECRI